MRLLFVTDTVPFPPRNGIEIVNAHLLAASMDKHDVDLLVVTEGEGQARDLESLRANVPAGISLHTVQARQRPMWWRMILELVGIRPTYFVVPESDEALRIFFREHACDLIWVGAVGCMGVIERAAKLHLLDKTRIAVGINEAASVLYRATFMEVLYGRRDFTLASLMRWLRAPMIEFHERRYLHNVDIVHVQTMSEKQRLQRILSRNARPSIVDAPNGTRRELEAIEYDEASQTVVIMENLTGERAKGVKWVVAKVWPLIARSRPEARLLIAGKPPRKDDMFWKHLPSQVSVLGYIDDLSELYAHAAVAVVPTIRGTGIINRVLDALMAGVPVVSTREALCTIPNLCIGEHAMACGDHRQFAKAILTLLGDNELRRHYSRKGRMLALGHRTWEQSMARLLQAIDGIDPSLPDSATSKHHGQTNR